MGIVTYRWWLVADFTYASLNVIALLLAYIWMF